LLAAFWHTLLLPAATSSVVGLENFKRVFFKIFGLLVAGICAFETRKMIYNEMQYLCVYLSHFSENLAHQSPSVSLPEMKWLTVFEPPLRMLRMYETCFLILGHLIPA
jgi:hypothetical protein